MFPNGIREGVRALALIPCLFLSSQGLVDVARELEGTSCRRAKGVQRRTEGQLKDQNVFPPENTVSYEPALLGNASGGRHIKAICRQAWKSFQLEKRILGGRPHRKQKPTQVCHLAAYA